MSTDGTFNLQRQARLLAELQRQGAVHVKEVARDFGVSETTVRRDMAALADRKLVTRVHGGATIPTLFTGPVQRSARVRTRFKIGMLVPSLDFYWPPIVTGARTAAAVLGVDIQLRESSCDPAEDRRQISQLIEAQRVQGLLLAPSLKSEGTEEMLDWIGRLPVPAVLVERQAARWTPTARQMEWVCSNHALGIDLAVRHLHQYGHRQIALVLSKNSPTATHLAAGWRAACADLGLSDEMVVRESLPLSVPGHREVISDLLHRCRQSGTTALVVHNDPMSVARICAEQGVSIPDDLVLVSYDDEVARPGKSTFTTVRPSKCRVGRMAVELMVSRLLEGDRRPSHRFLVAPELVIRASSLPRLAQSAP